MGTRRTRTTALIIIITVTIPRTTAIRLNIRRTITRTITRRRRPIAVIITITRRIRTTKHEQYQ